MKHTPLPFFFPESSLFLSEWWTENPACCTDGDSISRQSHDSVKQSMLQTLMSLWKEILALSSSTLLSRDWTLASNILVGSGWCTCLLSRRSPLRIPLLHWQRLGAAFGISSIALGIQFGNVAFLVVMLVSYRRSDIQKLFPVVCYNTKKC
jgi:hypothetical protein